MNTNKNLKYGVIALVAAGIALAAGGAEQWVIAVAAAALGGWMLTMSVRLLRRR